MTTAAAMQNPNRVSSAQDLHARDVAAPGLWKQRKREVKELEEHAGAPSACCPRPGAPLPSKHVPAAVPAGGSLGNDGGSRPCSGFRVHLRVPRPLVAPAVTCCRSGWLGNLHRQRLSRPPRSRKLPPPCRCPPPAVTWVPWLNRGTNFSLAEREELRLEGLLPPVVESLDLQARDAPVHAMPGDLVQGRACMPRLHAVAQSHACLAAPSPCGERGLRVRLRGSPQAPQTCAVPSLQADRVMCQLREEHKTDLQRYSILNQLLSSNQTLYYKAGPGSVPAAPPQCRLPPPPPLS